MESLALTNGETGGSFVGAELVSSSVDNVTLADAHAVSEPTPSVPIRNKANVVTVGLLSNAQTTLCCLGTNEVLRRGVSQREHGVGKLVGGEHTENIGLIFGPRTGAVKLEVAVGIGNDIGIVTGADSIETERQSLFHQGSKLDLLVAAHAGVWCATGLIFSNEVIDHVGLEAFGEVPHVVGNAEHGGSTLRIHRVFDGAATTCTGTQGARHTAER